MKTKSLFVAALLMISAVVVAAGKDDSGKTGMAIIPVKGSEVFKVVYKGEASGKVKLNIYDADNRIIMTETYSGVDGFICPLNFAGLKSGVYTVEIVDATGKKFEKVTFQPKKIAKSLHVSKIKNEIGKYLLSVATGAEKVNVKIYDEKNNLIHTETKNVSGDFAQVYKLNSTSPSFTFEVSDDIGNSKIFRL